MYRLFKIHSLLLSVVVIILLSMPAVLPYFHSGYFPTHDGEWAVVRLGDMYREVKDLQIPPRYSGNLNFGYGYPLFNFAYPFIYYLGLGIHFFHVGLVESIKLLFLLSVPFSGIGMFFLGKAIWKNNWLAGVVSAVFYLYFPYRMVDLYVRGSLGEAVASVLFPLILYFLLKLSERPKSLVYLCLSAISLACLVMTHNIMAVLFGLILVPFVLYLWYRDKTVLVPFVALFILAAGLSAFFWVPALSEKHLIALSIIPIADRQLYYVTIPQLLFSSWGYGVPTEKYAFTYQIGWAQLAIFLITAFVLIFTLIKRKSSGKTDPWQFALLTLCICAAMLLMLFRFTDPIWHLPLLKEINYPWTLLQPIGFLMSLLAGYLILQTKYLQYLVIFLTVVSIILVLPDAHPNYYVNRGDGFYLTNNATTTSSDELMPLWVKQKPLAPPSEKIQMLKGEGTISNVSQKSQRITFTAQVTKNAVVQINTIYYPGWQVRVNGKDTQIHDDNPHGVMQIDLSPGTNEVVAVFTETPVRLISDIISLASISLTIALVSFGVFRRTQKKGKNA